MARSTWTILAVALAATLARSARASPSDLFGFGPRSQAMGATGAAVARGFEATYENPALLSRARRRQLSLGFQAARFSLSAAGPHAPGEVGQDALRGTFIGAVMPLPFGGFLRHRIALGIGAFTPSSLIARARLLYPEQPQFPVLADRAQSLDFNLGIGLDLGHGIRIGGGARALAELTGSVVVATNASGQVGTVVDDQLVATYAPVLGAALDFGHGWSAGVTWRGALEADFNVLVQVHDLGALVVPDLHIAGVAQYDPMDLQAEVAKKIGPLTIAAGATFKHWSAFGGWTRATVQCPATEPDCKALKTTPVDFHDTIVPHVGLEYTFRLPRGARAHARAGYFFEPSPVPDQTGESNYWDNDRHALTLGYGIELGPPLRLSFDVFFQQHFLVSRTQTKTSKVAQTNAGYPSVRTSGSVEDAGLVAGVAF